MQTLEQLEQAVLDWAADKGIFSKATPYKQAQKTLEECGELLYAIGKMETADNLEDPEAYGWAQVECVDAIGDILVTLAIQARMQGFTLEDCFRSAYNEIKDRKGQMINGQFVKSNQ